MQELLEWVRATLPMDLDTPRMIEEKIESLLEKEKEVIEKAYDDGYLDSVFSSSEQYFEKTFNTKEK